MSGEESDGYEVGYRKPPTHSRFRKGRSGYPAGRKKSPRVEDLGQLLKDILAEEVIVRDGKHKRKMTNLEAMLHAQKFNALKANYTSILTLFRIADSTGMLTPAAGYKSNVELIEREGDQARILRMHRKEQLELKRRAFGSSAPEDKP